MATKKTKMGGKCAKCGKAKGKCKCYDRKAAN